ncbi:hypothetical protein COMNV_01115 [Commensalibacter sp. Nvir]|uniref:hemolysin family protein n=1 Tax=Commensalibacter sp. Nvir TaxID=3069817 RepID=UPI002D256D50|nr:hypothetical protein COMNV_01115 [Commensalibacter sp. Nvir]
MPSAQVAPDNALPEHPQPSQLKLKGLRSIFNKLSHKNRCSNLRKSIENLVVEKNKNNLVSGEHLAEELTTHEKLLITNILKLRGKTADDVMLPRADVFAISDDICFEKALEIMRHENHSRVPVYHEQLDNIVGMLHVKDLVAYIGRSDQFNLNDVLRQPLFVAPQIPVLDLLLQMRSQQIHLGLVIDEYGSVDGLVTIEDLVETIVGDIADEHDDPKVQMIVQKDPYTFDLDARMPLEDLENQVGTFLSAEERNSDIDTIGGLVFLMAEHIPTKGEVFNHASGLVFRVLDADPRHIKRLRLQVPKIRQENETEFNIQQKN